MAITKLRQRGADFSSRREALSWIFGETSADDALELDLAVELSRFLRQDGRHRFDSGRPSERSSAAHCFVQQRAQGENVARGLQTFATHLLRRHIRKRAQDCPRLSDGCLISLKS